MVIIWLAFGLHTLSSAPLLYAAEKSNDLNNGTHHFWLSWFLALLLCLGGKRVRYPIIQSCVAGTTALLIVSSSLMVHETAPTGYPLWSGKRHDSWISRGSRAYR